MVIIDMNSKIVQMYKNSKFIDQEEFIENEMKFEILFTSPKDIIQIMNQETYVSTECLIEAYKSIDQRYFLNYYHEKISKYIAENIKDEFEISSFYKYIQNFKN